jgi:hypothetical protein
MFNASLPQLRRLVRRSKIYPTTSSLAIDDSGQKEIPLVVSLFSAPKIAPPPSSSLSLYQVLCSHTPTRNERQLVPPAKPKERFTWVPFGR